MKIIKKYEYKLSEETLDKDIEQFIKEARKGTYTWDYKYGMEGLKIIKQYFKLIQLEFDKDNFELCKNGYKNLLFLLFEEGHKHSYFGYEDIVGRSKLNFDKIIQNYFLCLIRLHPVNDLLNEYVEYLRAKGEYHFEAAETAIKEKLSYEDFAQFKELLLVEADKVKKENYAMYDILTFLLDIAKKKEHNEEKFMELAEKFSPIFGYLNLKEFLQEYEE